MKFGICNGDVENIALCKKLGFDYIETGFSLLANEDEAPYEAFRRALEENEIPCLSVNCFLPGSLKVTGPQADDGALSAYVSRGMRRGKAMGVRKVVFGSSGARDLPEGFPFDEGVKQVIHFLRDIVSPSAAENGITVVIEPLSRKDTNIIHTLREGASLVAAVDRENIRLLGDLYHMYNNGDGPLDIRMMKGILKHAHIAEPTKRVFPAPDDGYDYRPFIEALEFAGCETCSVEARSSDFAADAAKAIEALRNA